MRSWLAILSIGMYFFILQAVAEQCIWGLSLCFGPSNWLLTGGARGSVFVATASSSRGVQSIDGRLKLSATEVVSNKSCQQQKLSATEAVRNESCQQQKLSETEAVRKQLSTLATTVHYLQTVAVSNRCSRNRDQEQHVSTRIGRNSSCQQRQL
jgi:hypothetical protein